MRFGLLLLRSYWILSATGKFQLRVRVSFYFRQKELRLGLLYSVAAKLIAHHGEHTVGKVVLFTRTQTTQ